MLSNRYFDSHTIPNRIQAPPSGSAIDTRRSSDSAYRCSRSKASPANYSKMGCRRHGSHISANCERLPDVWKMSRDLAARRTCRGQRGQKNEGKEKREDGFRNRICRGPSFRPRITPSRARRAQTVEIREEESVARADPSFLSPLRKITFPIQIVIACKTSLARDTSAHISHRSPRFSTDRPTLRAYSFAYSHA